MRDRLDMLFSAALFAGVLAFMAVGIAAIVLTTTTGGRERSYGEQQRDLCVQTCGEGRVQRFIYDFNGPTECICVGVEPVFGDAEVGVYDTAGDL